MIAFPRPLLSVLSPFPLAGSSPFNSAHTSSLFRVQQEQTGKCNLYSRDCVSKMFINSILFMYLSIWAQNIRGNLCQFRISFVPQSQALAAIMAVPSAEASDLTSLLDDVHRLQGCLPPSPRNTQTCIDRQGVSILVRKQGQCGRMVILILSALVAVLACLWLLSVVISQWRKNKHHIECGFCWD